MGGVMLNFLWNKLFGLKCPTPGCKNRLKQVKESSRPMGDQFYCKRCDITYTGSQLKLFKVNGYDKIDPTGRRKQAVLMVPFECPKCYETFSMPVRKSEDTTASRFLCPICKHYFANPKYVKPEPVVPEAPKVPPEQAVLPGLTEATEPFETTVPDPAAEFVPYLNLCDTCSKEMGECDGQPVFDGETNGVIECSGCVPKEEGNGPTEPA
jgi:hypothetical protein